MYFETSKTLQNIIYLETERVVNKAIFNGCSSKLFQYKCIHIIQSFHH